MQYVIVFAILLLFLILFLQNKPIIEALTNEEDSSPQEKYQQYANNNTMILAEKNAANIEYLKSRLDRWAIQKSKFSSVEAKVDKNTDAIKQMSQLATQHFSNVTGITGTSSTPPAIKKLGSIGQNAGNYINPMTSTTTHISPSRPDPTAPLN